MKVPPLSSLRHRGPRSAPVAVLAAAALLAASLVARAQEAKPTEAERFAELEKTLSGAALVGHFTVTGGREMTPRTERYDLGEVKHLEGENWLITSRIRYGGNDVSIPLTLPIRWAGDTPVITVDDMAFPGLGTYTARVMIYRDHYVGFWTGKDHGGHLYGVIERGKAEEKEQAKAAE
jgi:hypothetical protein